MEVHAYQEVLQPCSLERSIQHRLGPHKTSSPRSLPPRSTAPIYGHMHGRFFPPVCKHGNFWPCDTRGRRLKANIWGRLSTRCRPAGGRWYRSSERKEWEKGTVVPKKEDEGIKSRDLWNEQLRRSKGETYLDLGVVGAVCKQSPCWPHPSGAAVRPVARADWPVWVPLFLPPPPPPPPFKSDFHSGILEQHPAWGCNESWQPLPPTLSGVGAEWAASDMADISVEGSTNSRGGEESGRSRKDSTRVCVFSDAVSRGCSIVKFESARAWLGHWITGADVASYQSFSSF